MAVDGARLLACHARGQQAWPGIEVPYTRFLAYVSEMAAEESTCEEHAADLYLAVAVLDGDPRALEALDRAYVRPACGMAARLDSSHTFRQEVEQQLRVRLLAGSEPRLRLYRAGSGLIEWMRVAAWRLALDIKRTDARHVPTEHLPLEPLLGSDLEREAITGRYLDDFRRALAEGFRRLPPRERTLLRLHFVNGLNVDAIGTAYGVHRATVARWLVAIRRSLLDSTRELLATTLPLDSRSIRSLYRLLEPELHITLSGLLAVESTTQSDVVRSG
jgi:RNA polymerase sigma-70 factor (ECF subfamily)